MLVNSAVKMASPLRSFDVEFTEIIWRKKILKSNICDNGEIKAVMVHLGCIFYYSRFISYITCFSEPLEWSW